MGSHRIQYALNESMGVESPPAGYGGEVEQPMGEQPHTRSNTTGLDYLRAADLTRHIRGTAGAPALSNEERLAQMRRSLDVPQPKAAPEDEERFIALQRTDERQQAEIDGINGGLHQLEHWKMIADGRFDADAQNINALTSEITDLQKIARQHEAALKTDLAYMERLRGIIESHVEEHHADQEDAPPGPAKAPWYSYVFKLKPEVVWAVVAIIAGGLMTAIADVNTQTDWAAWGLTLGVALARPILGLILSLAQGHGVKS